LSARIVVVTGTDTGVGKTIATAALAVTAPGSVQVIKPAQTGLADPDEPGDGATVTALAGCPTHTYVELGAALAPSTAARLEGTTLPNVIAHADRIRAQSNDADLTLVEGAGGLLVRLDGHGGTLLDLACELDAHLDVEVVVVCRAGLGTLNHTELTVGALRARGIEPTGLVIGAWPDRPDLAATWNRAELPQHTGLPLLAVLPEGAGRLHPEDFRRTAPDWFLD
jgi:dethiobiotin synthase